MIIRATTAALQTTGTTPVSQNITVASGPGSTVSPKAAIFELAGSTTVNTLVAGRRHSVGITDGTSQYSIGTMAENGQLSAAADSGNRWDNASVLDFPQLGSEALDGGVDWNAWVAGGATVRTLDLFASAVQAKAVYFFGDDIECEVVEVGQADTEVTGLSFAPNFAFVIGAAGTWGSNQSSPVLATSIGYAVKTPAGGVQQVCYAELMNDRNSVATNGAATIRDNACAVQLGFLSSTPVVGGTLSIASWEDDGVTFASASPLNCAILFIRFKGERKLYAGVRAITESAGDVAVTEPGFHAAAYFAIATPIPLKNILATDSEAGPITSFSHGVYTGEEDVHVSEQATDGVSPSSTRSLTGDNAVFNVLDGAGGSSLSATHVSLDTTGFTINVAGSALGNSPQVAFVAISTVPVVGTDTETVTEAASLLQRHFKTASDTETLTETATLAGLAHQDASDTETISETSALVAAATQVASDAEEILEAVYLLQSYVLEQADTEEITETFALVYSDTVMAVASDVESLSESVALLASALSTADDTEEITEAVAFLGDATQVADDLVDITERAYLRARAIISANDTVDLSEASARYPGAIVYADDTVTIDDQEEFGDLVRTHATARGSTFAGGAVAGVVYSGGAARGRVL